jgi:DNA polymerase III subunit delta'
LYACHMVRQAMLIHQNAHDIVRLPDMELQFIEKFAPFIGLSNGEYIFDQLSSAYTHIERNANPKIVFLDSSLALSSAFSRK